MRPDTRERQETLLQALSESPTLKAAATVANIPYSTARLWMKDTEFAKRYQEIRRQILRSAIASAQYRLLHGSDIMWAIVADPNERTTDRIAAYRALTDIALRGFELLDVDERLTAIEAQLDKENVYDAQSFPVD